MKKLIWLLFILSSTLAFSQVSVPGWNVTGAGGAGGGTTCGTPTCTISSTGLGNGVLALAGNTSGTCTQTVDATSTTVTSSCLQAIPNGTQTGGSIRFPFQPYCFYSGASGSVFINTCSANTDMVAFANGSAPAITQTSGGVYDWSSSGVTLAGANQSHDTGLSRIAAGVVAVGNGATNDTTAKVKAAGYMSVGTTFTSNAGCGDTTLVGGATAGKYTSVTAGTCTTIITMGNSATAPNGWSCTATDLTTAGDAGNIKQTATNATTASLNEGTVAANDVIQFSCIGY